MGQDAVGTVYPSACSGRWVQLSCRVSAVLMSVGSSFHHCGAGTANNQHLVGQQMGSLRSEGVAGCLAATDCGGRAGVYGETMSRIWERLEPHGNNLYLNTVHIYTYTWVHVGLGEGNHHVQYLRFFMAGRQILHQKSIHMAIHISLPQL